MGRLDKALVDLAERHRPISVRGLFYRATVSRLVPKEERLGYALVQRRSVVLRRRKVIPYGWIVNGARTVYGHERWTNAEAFQQAMAGLYRKDYSAQLSERIEIWCEKDALRGVLRPVTDEAGLDLYVTRGFASLTYLEDAAEAIWHDGRPAHIYILTDLDPSGLCIADRIERELTERAAPIRIHVQRLAVTPEQVQAFSLPTRPTKTTDRRAAKFMQAHGDQSAELDAFDPNDLRRIVRDAIEQHMDPQRLALLKRVEEEERLGLALLAGSRTP